MNSTLISRKISTGQVITYRRVSTEPQAKSEYAHQLRIIKTKYPTFKASRALIDGIAEVMSGCADAKVRMNSGLGRCLRHLKRNPDAILLVSQADRIARSAKIFLLIQQQGLGRRVFEASTEMSLDEIIDAGVHLEIERQTEAQRASRKAGVERRMRSGGVVGSQDLGELSVLASQEKIRLADEREAAVLSVIRRLVLEGRGRHPSLGEISDELTKLEIYTGQGRSFTPERLSQLKKRNPGKWKRAFGLLFPPKASNSTARSFNSH